VREGMCFLGLASVVLMLAGCQTTGWEQQRQQESRLATEVAELRISMQRIEHRLVGFAQEQDVLGHDLQRLRADHQQQTSRQDAGLAALSGRLDEQARAQTAMRRELADDLSTRMEAILQTQARTAAAAQRAVATGPRAPQAGYEHVVQTGETLSEIARAYGVTANAILQANQMRDPNVLRVGQKLFIPERPR
jgi:LysM repeat protein